MAVKANPGPKKSYSPPELIVYGTVVELTKAVGTHGNSDSGRIIGHTKTHV
jgi:hypothetical protein